MKRLIISIIFITFILSMLEFNYADTESVEIVIPEFDVRVNGILIDTAHSQYPVITYKNITYFPMTSDYLVGIGLNLSFTGAEGLKINVKKEIGKLEQNFLGASNLVGSSHTAQITPFRVEVNGKVLNNAEEEYPILLYKNITYFPMTWRFAVTEFGWSTKWSASTGFGIIIEKEGEWEEINYVSIGDSIATGFSDVKNTEAYPVGIEKLLSGAKIVNYYDDAAYEGMTTGAILSTIESPEFSTSKFATAITKADIITISIGGNDLLSALLKPVAELADNLNDCVELFYQNWPKLVDCIRLINPTADIYVLNLYNPFNYTLAEGYEYEYNFMI